MKHTIHLKLCLAVIVAALTVSTGCKKKEDAPAKSKTELLTNKEWILKFATVDPPLPYNGTHITDFYAQLEDCKKDNYDTYLPDGSYISNEGASKCDPNDPQATTGTWKFINNETEIDDDGDIYKILELTETKLKYSFIITANSTNYTVTGTFGIK